MKVSHRPAELFAVFDNPDLIAHAELIPTIQLAERCALPRAMATFRSLAIGPLKPLGADNIAKTTRAIRNEPERALAILGITNNPGTQGT
ncbi:hypothetical protein ACH46N_14295 [Streptomyces pristinaespiralis]|uniref:Uncharacterized protein n=2 Tax=Streptomyces pristinaespiralis TaxID=38300 RepID=B5HJP6_STRE2|nr:hypothetical protein [Streptomyces pristinaespiralis]ALC20213.1 transposase [Streptomyces pristinaespiralis]EDY67057.1 conserved hypothetical protein [Streptomyces pristinaespiralis ATCC 25486]